MARMMIVDDTSFMRRVLRGICERLGNQVVAEATNGLEAVKMYPKFIPDLVIMDITMPEMDGIEAAKQILKFDPYANIVMCSAMAHQQSVIQAVMVGAKDFISKPFMPERVEETIRKVMSGQMRSEGSGD